MRFSNIQECRRRRDDLRDLPDIRLLAAKVIAPSGGEMNAASKKDGVILKGEPSPAASPKYRRVATPSNRGAGIA